VQRRDGYRGIATLGNGEVRIAILRGLDMAAWFAELAGLATAIGGHQAVLDGELVALDPAGPTSRRCSSACAPDPSACGTRAGHLPGLLCIADRCPVGALDIVAPA